MAHFAQLDETGIVTGVIALEDVVITDESDNEVEQLGIDFLTQLYGGGQYRQTSYNTRAGVHYAPNSHTPDGGVALRKNYAGKGFQYDSSRDAFIQPQTYPSWTLNESTCRWDSPVAHPDDGGDYEWNEDAQSWDIA